MLRERRDNKYSAYYSAYQHAPTEPVSPTRKHAMQDTNVSFGVNSHSAFLSMSSVTLMVKDG